MPLLSAFRDHSIRTPCSFPWVKEVYNRGVTPQLINHNETKEEDILWEEIPHDIKGGTLQNSRDPRTLIDSRGGTL
jgi:hypothetical protein